MAKVRRQAGLIRDLVPQLRNMYDPEPIDWIPQIQYRSPVLLGLDMANPAIVQTMSRYGRSSNPSATFREFDNSSRILGFAEGFGLEDRRIVTSYSWILTSGGLSSYEDDVCRNSEWSSIRLMHLLGGQAFNALASSWGEKQSAAGQTFMNRLFLQALYACPGSPASRDCVRAGLQAMVKADSFSIPKE